MRYMIQDRRTGQYVGDRSPLTLTTKTPLTWRVQHLAASACQQLNHLHGNRFVVKRSGVGISAIAGCVLALSAISATAFTLTRPTAQAQNLELKTASPQLELATFHVGESGQVAPVSQSTIPKTATAVADPDALKMVMVDQTLLTAEQRSQLAQLATQLPPTSVGKSCQYYGKPDVWCLILKHQTAEQVFPQLSPFGAAASIKPVKRFGKGISKDHPG